MVYTNKQALAFWTVRITASLILLNGLYWTVFGILCEWPDPVGMLAHMRFPAFPLLVLAWMAGVQPKAAGAILVLWGVQPFVSGLLGIEIRGDLFYLDKLLIFGLPLLIGTVLLAAGFISTTRHTTNTE